MKKHYLCNVFFMVLDLRLTKIDCRDDNHFFFYTYLIYNTSMIPNTRMISLYSILGT